MGYFTDVFLITTTTCFAFLSVLLQWLAIIPFCQVGAVLDVMGEASAKAQGLKQAITSGKGSEACQCKSSGSETGHNLQVRGLKHANAKAQGLKQAITSGKGSEVCQCQSSGSETGHYFR
jgi:hypothetical protein